MQTTLAVCGLDQCDLLVWTSLGMLVIEVPPDTVQFTSYMDCMECFYADHIITEMLTHAVRDQLNKATELRWKRTFLTWYFPLP